MVLNMVRPATGSRQNLIKTRVKLPRRTVADSSNIAIREHTVLVEIGQITRLFNECRRKTIRVRLVMSEFGVDVVVYL